MAPTGAAANVDIDNMYLDFLPETSSALVTLSGYLRFHNFTDVIWRLGISTTDFGGGYVVAAETETRLTLASPATAADATIGLTTSANPGAYILNPWSSAREAVTIRSIPTGAGATYTATLADPLVNNHSSGVLICKGSYEQFSGRYMMSVLVTGLTAGDSVRFLWKHSASRANAVSLQRNGATGYPALMTAVSV